MPRTKPLGPPQQVRLTAGCLAAVAVIALFDWWTGPQFSFGVFYLLPAAACAWWGGFSPGILLATAGAVGWCAVDLAESPSTPPTAIVWNGVTRFGTLALVASLAARVHAGVLRERRLARTDPLTGAANGRHFYEAVTAASDRARQSGEPLTLAYLDLDDFKQVNDHLGHATGDAVLSGLAGVIRAELGGSGLLARLGGDEFALLLPGVGPADAAQLLSRVSRQVAAEATARGWPVGVSIGAATFRRPGPDVDRMIQQADALMYAAKRAGKGRVEHAVVEPGSELLGATEGERRATARELSVYTARVRPTGADRDGGEYATVRDVTTEAVGIYMERQFPPETLLLVEPLAAGLRTLLARVVRSDSEPGGWVHRCVLPERLGEEDLRAWGGIPGPVPSPTGALSR
jgi:diguanylate cyclase (GGDEF)-like protein